jgi:hypothetical protein
VTILLCCGVLHVNYLWYRTWHRTPEEIEAFEIERMQRSIEFAYETGKLILFPDFWYGAPEFYATKQFQMIRDLKGVRSFECCGYLGVPVPAESVAAISTLTDLEKISFMNMHFEDQALLALQGLPELREISFYGCHVDMVSLQHIRQFEQIQTLSILCPMPFTGSNEISHQIDPEMQRQYVETLCLFPHLKNLKLQECFRSDLETLSQHLPDTHITFEDIGIDIP